MAGLLDDSGQFDIDPALLATMASNAGTPTWTPAAPDDTGTPAPAQTMATQPTPPDSGGGFWGNLASGIGDAGTVLGGGLDPSITGPARTLAGTRALLNFGLSMLMNSGPSYTPRNFGQILGAGLSSAAESNLTTEQNRIKAQQVGATLALKAGQLKIQELLAGIKGVQEGRKLDIGGKVGAAAAADLGGAGPGGAPATVAAPPASPGDFVSQNAPVFQDIAQKTGLPVDFVAGQAGNESAWGTSPAAVQGNNLFGILDPATGKPAAFPTKQAGVDAYVALLNGKYANVPRTGSAADIGTALGSAGYNTTDPAYGPKMGSAAALAGRLLPQPTTTGATGAPQPGTMVAGPGAGAGGAPAPAPSSTPPSPGTAVVGPASAPVPATVDQPANPTWATPKPPDFSDIPGRRAAAKAAYTNQIANVANSQDPNLRSTAEKDFQQANQTIDKEVADRTTEYNKTVADMQLRQKAEEAKIANENMRAQQQQAAETARNTATIQAENDRAAAQRAHELALENIKAGVNIHAKIQEQSAQYAQENVIKPMQDQAFKAHQMNLGLAQLMPMLPDLPKGGTPMAAFLEAHPDMAPLLGPSGANILDSKQVDAVRLIDGLVSNISTQMKPSGLGALREYEWNAFKAQLPNLMQSPDGQQKAVSLLMNMNNRIAGESGWMQQYFSRPIPDTSPNAKPGATVPAHNLDIEPDPQHPNESIQQRMDRQLGPVVPSYNGPLTGSGQAQWEQSLPPGKPYYKVWGVPDPKNPTQPRRDSSGKVMTTKTLEFRPW